MNRLIFALALGGGLAPAALGQEQPAPPAVERADPETVKLVTDCSARKFETVVEREENGEKKHSKVRLCGQAGQTDAEWVATLRDAASKIEGNPNLSQSAKEQLSAALAAEIAKVESAISTPAETIESERPAPNSVPRAPTIEVAPTAGKAMKKPRLALRCLEPGETGAGSGCSRLDRATRLFILAEDELSAGTSLKFLRRGTERGVLALAPMQRGETYRFKLPSELCAGVSSSKVAIQVMNEGQVMDTLGPYSLQC